MKKHCTVIALMLLLNQQTHPSKPQEMSCVMNFTIVMDFEGKPGHERTAIFMTEDTKTRETSLAILKPFHKDSEYWVTSGDHDAFNKIAFEKRTLIFRSLGYLNQARALENEGPNRIISGEVYESSSIEDRDTFYKPLSIRWAVQ